MAPLQPGAAIVSTQRAHREQRRISTEGWRIRVESEAGMAGRTVEVGLLEEHEELEDDVEDENDEEEEVDLLEEMEQ